MPSSQHGREDIKQEWGVFCKGRVSFLLAGAGQVVVSVKTDRAEKTFKNREKVMAMPLLQSPNQYITPTPLTANFQSNLYSPQTGKDRSQTTTGLQDDVICAGEGKEQPENFCAIDRQKGTLQWKAWQLDCVPQATRMEPASPSECDFSQLIHRFLLTTVTWDLGHTEQGTRRGCWERK